MKKPSIIISSCLLGNKVRFDGSGKPHKWVLKKLGPLVNFQGVCPEMAMGLGTPREAVRIVKDSEAKTLHLFTSKSGKDLTDEALDVTRRMTEAMDTPDGIILMSNSPMCGIKLVKVYESKNMIPHKDGEGFFAAAMMQKFPNAPIIEGFRLGDAKQREAFLSHVFSLQAFKAEVNSVSTLQAFHRRHKFLLLSYNPKVYRAMGPLVAGARKDSLPEVVQNYIILLKDVFQKGRASAHGSDALLHLYGFLKPVLSSPERHEILNTIEEYRKGFLDFQMPLRLISFLNLKAQNPYLSEQTIFAPYPKSLSY